MELQITEEMTEVKLLLESGHNVYLSGSAGTGKSTFLNWFRDMHPELNILVVAPTGIAALNVQGSTIHSMFRFPFNPITPSDVKSWSPERADTLRHADLIVIDEISMVRPDMLDAIDLSFRYNLKSKKDFGGKQILIMGDVFQLSPVVTKNEEEFYTKEYNGVYFFKSHIYKKAKFVFAQFTKIFRQQDVEYIENLQAIRQLRHTEDNLRYFNKRFVLPMEFPSKAIRITAFVKQAEEINSKRLAAISGQTQTYYGKIQGNFKYDSQRMLTPLNLQLKKDAQVVFTVNDREGQFKNGEIGHVTMCDSSNIYVKTKRNPCIIVQPHKWVVKATKYNAQDKRFISNEIGSFTQFPLVLGWAVTIHKSQGQTYEEVVIDTGSGTFAFGQLYVALSRCTSYEGVYLSKRISNRDIIRCQEVMDWWVEQINKPRNVAVQGELM